jgi:predicted dehydrogenase
MANPPLLRLGIIGCGYQGLNMARAAKKSAAFQVEACVDPDMAAAERLSKEMGGTRVYSTLDAMLKDSVIDAAVIATPHHLLCPLTLAAIQAGKHVLCEKPLGIIESEAAQIERAAAKAGVCVEAGYSFRRLPGWERAHSLLRTGAIGDMVAMTGMFSFPPMNTGWAAAPDTGGGPLFFAGSHLIDQMLWYADAAPVEVFAQMRHRTDTGTDEATAFQIHFDSGVFAQGLVTQTEGALAYRLDVRGRKGNLNLRPIGFLDFEVEVQSMVMPEYAQPTRLRSLVTDDVRLVMHVPQLQSFAAAIRDQRSPTVDVAAGRQVLRVIDAIFASGKAGQAVRLGKERLRNDV